MSWPSNQDGWAISDDQRGNRALLHTIDAGLTWVPAAIDANGALQIEFANTSNGWLVAESGLQSTHDGGSTWTAAAVPDAAGLAAVVSAQGVVHVAYIADSTRVMTIASSPIDHDEFIASPLSIPVGAGPRLDVSLTAGGPYAAMIYDDRVFVGAAQIKDGQWGAWGLKCPFDNPTATLGLSPQGTNLAVACGPSGFGDDAPIVAADLSKGKLKWVTVEPPSNPADGQASLRFATATDGGTRVVGYVKPGGAAELAGSTDGGATWPARTPLPDGTTPSAIAHLPDGGLVLSLSPSGGLISSGGITWTPVPTTPS